jgi:hypothetical protein
LAVNRIIHARVPDDVERRRRVDDLSPRNIKRTVNQRTIMVYDGLGGIIELAIEGKHGTVDSQLYPEQVRELMQSVGSGYEGAMEVQVA